MATWPVACLENEPLALFILEQRETFISENGYSESIDTTLSKAYRNVCDFKTPICSLRDARKVNGIGNWTLKLLKGFFPEENTSRQELHDASDKAEKAKARKRYIPQKSSAPYAILLTLYRGMQDGCQFMKKQELIDAAEASGLSRMPIQPSKGPAPSNHFGYSTKDWYSGWSSMKTLVSKGLVVKSSCPAKYMLTEEGKSAAEECLQRSEFLMDAAKPSCTEGMRKCSVVDTKPNGGSTSKVTHGKSSKHSRSSHGLIALEGVNHVNMRISPVQDSQNPFLIEDVRDLSSDSEKVENVMSTGHEESALKTEDFTGAPRVTVGDTDFKSGWLHLPPLKAGERFVDAYDVVIILDDREQYLHDRRGQNTRDKFCEYLRAQFEIHVEVKHLPVGDTLWLARHKLSKEEYVLDFIVERKKVNDLALSIRDTRYKQQKLRLLRCGLRKLIYVVEGDPNVMDSAESIKTACFTTEIAEGFNVQRTRDTRDTMRLYGHLTQAIALSYDGISSCQVVKQNLCWTYSQFVDHCKDLEKEKVSDVFGVMLMQVKNVTENIALSILEKYPTALSLVLAYSELEGNLKAQEQLLKGIPILNGRKEIGSAISKRVFQLVCSSKDMSDC